MTYYKMTADYRLKQRSIPKGSMLLNHPQGLGVAYVSMYDAPLRKDCWHVVAYRGSAAKPSVNNLYRTREEAEKAVESFF